MVGSRWRSHAAHVLHVSPMQRRGIELVQIVEVVAPVSASEDVDLVLVAICRVHVAGTWWLACELIVQPFELLQVQDVHVVGSKGPLPKPTANDVESIAHERSRVPIPALRRSSSRLD